ncbi:MAG TPA: glycosyltransferase family 39 protein [Armatimonadota bacterium]|jgi:4-amino-4-deoxy-L-arabinose transferase-like glycosyltransferase
MADILALISQLSFVIAAMLFTRLLRPRHPVQFLLTYALVLPTLIVLLGYALSAGNHFGQAAWWAGGSVAILLLIAVPVSVHPGARALCWRKISTLREVEQRLRKVSLTSFDGLLLLLLGIVTGVVLLIDFAILLSLEPATLDALIYHLPRVFYYLQQGNLHYFDANYWALVVHPKVSTILFAYAYLLGGHMANLTQLVQFLACLVSMLAIYGIARELGSSRRGGMLAALLFALLPICLTEAATAQNDLLLTAFAGVMLYFLLVFRTSRAVPHLLLAGLAFALGLGVKATMTTCILPVLPLVIYALLPRAGERPATLRWAAIGVGGLLCWLVMIALPSGYGENIRVFGNPFGPGEVRRLHSYEGVPSGSLLRYGALNLARYASDFLTLDGLEPIPGALRIQAGIDGGIKWLTNRCGVDLASDTGTRAHFGYAYEHGILANESRSFWGILGFLLIWPAVFLALWKKQPAGVRLLAVGAILFFIVQAFVSPYDAFRGRYFITGALLALPCLALLVPQRTWWGRGYLALVLLVGGVTAICSALFRADTYVFPYFTQGRWHPSTFTMNRAEQITREAPSLYQPLFNLDDALPEHAILANDIRGVAPFPEFLLFGELATRKVIPLRPWRGQPKDLPTEANYLIYTPDSRFRQPGDMQLGGIDPVFGTLYLRKLK